MPPKVTTVMVLLPITCGVCGIPFALEDSHLTALKSTGRDFYCPNGHMISYGESEATKLKRQLKSANEHLDWSRTSAQAARDQAAAAERSARAYKGVATRVRRRAAHGVCPCCTRTFADVAKHMSGQHPDFVTEHGTTQDVQP